MAMPRKPMSGKYHKLTVISDAIARDGVIWYRFRCECGTEKEIRASDVRTGNARSCGHKSCRQLSIKTMIARLEDSIFWLEESLKQKREQLSELLRKEESRCPWRKSSKVTLK